MNDLYEQGVPPISEFDPELLVCWFIPRKVVKKKTKRGKPIGFWKLLIATLKCLG